jgi:hypothetical protein
MRPYLRRSALVAVLVTLAVLMSGCIHLDRDVGLNGDGSGTYTLSVGLSDQLMSLSSDQITQSMNQFGDKVKQQGGSYRHYEDSGYSYWAFTRPFKSVNQLNALLQETPQSGNGTAAGGTVSAAQDTLTVTETPGVFTNSFHLTGHISMLAPSDSSTDTGGVDVSQYFKDAHESVSITMPGWVSSHKQGEVSGNTVKYTIHYNEQTDIDVAGGGANPQALLLAITAGVLILVLIGAVAFWLVRRRRAGEAVPTTVGAAIPSESPFAGGTQ